jgi:hypothetical protein
LRKLTPRTVSSTAEQTGVGIRIGLDTGAIVVHPKLEEIYVEIAEITGFTHGAWLVYPNGRRTPHLASEPPLVLLHGATTGTAWWEIVPAYVPMLPRLRAESHAPSSRSLA